MCRHGERGLAGGQRYVPKGLDADRTKLYYARQTCPDCMGCGYGDPAVGESCNRCGGAGSVRTLVNMTGAEVTYQVVPVTQQAHEDAGLAYRVIKSHTDDHGGTVLDTIELLGVSIGDMEFDLRPSAGGIRYGGNAQGIIVDRRRS